MKKLIVGVVLLFALAGCRGVVLNAEYSGLLDRTTSLSAETAMRARAGQLTPADMTAALDFQAKTWQLFKNGRDGVGGAP